MAMVDVGHIAAYRRTHSIGWLAWSEDWQLAGVDLHLSYELCELSKLLVS